jgi:ribosomal protein S18 acetylase RimI-like enzyme
LRSEASVAGKSCESLIAMVAPEPPIRTAMAADREPLAELDRRAWTLATNPILPDGKGWFDAELDLSNVLLVMRETQLLGYVHLDNALPPHLYSAAHSARIRGLAVAPEARGQGLASRLLDAAQDMARNRGYRKLILQVLSSNLVAQRCYERAGFTCEGRIVGLFFLNGSYVDDLWYGKWL